MMRACRRAVTIAAILAAAFAGVSAQATNPRMGSWKLNLQKSKYSPGPPPKSQALTIEPSGESEKVTSEVTAADGARSTIVYTAAYDGKDYPVTGSNVADTVSLKRIDARTSERTDKKGGKVVQTFRRVVSADGKTMTVTIKGKTDKGQPMNNVVVFDKQ
jgi:hypothetical protein